MGEVRDRWEYRESEYICWSNGTHDFEYSPIYNLVNDEEYGLTAGQAVKICARCRGVFAVDTA